MNRAFWVRMHRYLGLATALFLLLAGVTGSILAFGHEIDAWLNPDWFRADPAAKALPIDALVRRIEASHRDLQVDYLTYDGIRGHPAMAYVSGRPDVRTNTPAPLDYDQVFADPATGRILGSRGSCCLQTKTLIPFVRQFHYSLYLPGEWGRWFMGIVGMLWLVDGVVALYLTFPRQSASFWRKWRPAWLVKRGAGAYRLTFDLHRAGGLWLWLIFVVLAVSSVDLNLRSQITAPLVSMFSRLTPLPEPRPVQRTTAAQPPVMTFGSVWKQADDEARRRGWRRRVSGVSYDRDAGMFVAFLRPSHNDDGRGLGSPRLFYSAASGALLGATVPGEGTAGDLFLQTLYPLHSGQIAGLPGRIVIAAAGLVVAMLSVTGVLIWLRKRGARATARRA